MTNEKIITSAQQLHQEMFNTEPVQDAQEKLFIDLDICAAGTCKECELKCSYLYHPDNNGIISVAELATYALVCRRCDEPHCVNACPWEALEQQPRKNKLLIRHNMRCVSCKSCSHACPYGTIYPENVPYLGHNCDFCLDRRTDIPLCIKSCPHGALKLVKSEPTTAPDTFLAGDNLIVHVTRWDRERA